MQGKILKVVTSVIVVMLLGVVLLGCGKSEPAGPSVEPEYAGDIAERMLLAFDTGDYAAYSERLDPPMMQAMPEETFQKGRAFIREKIGDYISKEFVETQIVEEVYMVVIYKAKYSNEPADVKVTVTFMETDAGILVSGLYFDSPKLRSQ